MSFVDDLKAEFEAERPTVGIDVMLNGALYALRFTRMEALDWASACDMYPARPKVPMDIIYGYNLRPLSLLVASQTGKLVEGDKLTDLTPDQWTNLFKALPGASVSRIGDVLFYLNQNGPDDEIAVLKEALKKAPEVEPNSDSPSSLVSLPGDSPAGSQEK